MAAPWSGPFVKHRDDAFLLAAALAYGFGVPLLFAFAALRHVRGGGKLDLMACYVYHVLRVGPFFMNFAMVYTLCHKEGHATAARRSLWRQTRGPLPQLFNWWAGMFYGVLPSSFAVGHSLNHHRYDNAASDVVTTADKPRDSKLALLCYLPRFGMYTTNLSTTWQFARERNWRVALATAAGTVYYSAFVGFVAWRIGWNFALSYLGYPLLEQTLLLSGVNWTWHAFVDPTNPGSSPFVESVTIVQGRINVLQEDSHVVHHQYPGAHWAEHPRLLLKHGKGYDLASLFCKTHVFELLGLILLRDYEKLANRYVGHLPPNGAEAAAGGARLLPDHGAVAALLRARLRTCTWGLRASQTPHWAAVARKAEKQLRDHR
ncbi:hypothetical protein M885DRAFT_598571 [Pelagophyceae sp. CCMP2097]|nr:hypothetical protein M885DRAFT_598571 [Pelagophyceae sp. CCMP2097]